MASKNPFVKGNVTRLKLVLPITKEQAWRLIATPRGLESWFPVKCRGTVRLGKVLEFTWPDGSSEEHRVINVGEKHSSLILEWWNTGRAAFYLHGRQPVHLTLEVTYSRASKAWQAVELVGWTFFLSNLKSVALKGRDLRSKSTRFSWKKSYID